MNRPTVLIEARPFCVFDTSALDKLTQAPVDVVNFRGKGMADPAFVQALHSADIVLCGNDLNVDGALLDQAPRLQAVAKMGAGLDTVDIAAATARDILVFHTPGVNNQAVADHTFALILALARRILFCDRSLREGRWEHTKIMGLEIWEKTMGLLGLGAIGRCVALRAKGFAMKVVAYDPYWPEAFAKQHDIQRMGLNEVLASADILSLHLPLTPETRNLIDARALARMKPGAILVNAARGGVVNEQDLYQALTSGRLAGAGLDVFEKEPPVDSPLMGLDNVVLTPHTAAFTHEAMNKMNHVLVDQIIAWAQGQKPAHSVNPQVWKMKD